MRTCRLGRAFCAIRADGHVVTWGIASHGGDSTAVQERLVEVQDVVATSRAFAALRADGEVITWGAANYGGESDPETQLKDVQQLCASHGAFAALRADGEIVTWGFPLCGGSGPELGLKKARNVFWWRDSGYKHI